MSAEKILKCWEVKLPPMQKIVLMALADEAGGRSSFTNASYLAEIACVSRGTVLRVVKELEAKGMLVRAKPKQGFWHYELKV